MHRSAKFCHTGGPMTSIGLYNFLPDIIHTKTGQALLVLGVCPAAFLMDGSLRRVQRTHGFLGVFHQVQQACRVAGVVLGQALSA